MGMGMGGGERGRAVTEGKWSAMGRSRMDCARERARGAVPPRSACPAPPGSFDVRKPVNWNPRTERRLPAARAPSALPSAARRGGAGRRAGGSAVDSGEGGEDAGARAAGAWQR